MSRMQTGEMPPKGAPRPDASKVEAVVGFVEKELDRLDSVSKPDPGRVTAKRLNRVEYGNTVRDLLGVHFRADEEFPPDDSGYGFDNIGDVLTVSPALMQKYLFAAERIASRAVGGDPLPKPGVFNLKARVRRAGSSAIQLTDGVEHDAEYIVRAMLLGHRGAEGKPIAITISVDGKPVKTALVDTAQTLVNKQGGATQRTSEEARVYLTSGPHKFRVELASDDFTQKLSVTARTNPNSNIFPDSVELVGPFAPKDAPASRKKLLVCDPAGGPACVERILTPVVRRAYRRPVTRAEVLKLVSVSTRARGAGYTPAQSLQFALSAMLVSPQFLFRMERDPRVGTGKISDVELASRLSYFLWSSMPDDTLQRLAEAGMLSRPAVLRSQIKRMLDDERSSALAANFAGQWLEIRSLDAAKPDPKKFPTWSPELKEAMRTETEMFFAAILREDRPVSEFIDAKYTYLNDLLAKHYGIPDVIGADFRRVDLPIGQRGGVLTHASVLTVSSYPSRTSVVLRGKYLLENILGAPPPPPPADVPALDEAAVGNSKSLRQQMEAHRANTVCASCHARMDVLGFGLENYDAVGAWRTADGKFAVDPSGTFPNGKSFTTPAEMKSLLTGNMPEFARCLTEKMLTYALGRGVETYDGVAIRKIVRTMAANDYRIRTLVQSIVESVPFQARRVVPLPVSAQPRVSKKIAKNQPKEIASR